MDNKHALNRFKICLLCYGKTNKMFPIKDKLKADVEKVFKYDSEDLLASLCSLRHLQKNFVSSKKWRANKYKHYKLLSNGFKKSDKVKFKAAL